MAAPALGPPRAHLCNCHAARHPDRSRDETLPFFIGGLTATVRKPIDHLTTRHACGALSVINHRVYHPTQATQDSLLAVLPQLIALLGSEDLGGCRRQSALCPDGSPCAPSAFISSTVSWEELPALHISLLSG